MTQYIVITKFNLPFDITVHKTFGVVAEVEVRALWDAALYIENELHIHPSIDRQSVVKIRTLKDIVNYEINSISNKHLLK